MEKQWKLKEKKSLKRKLEEEEVLKQKSQACGVAVEKDGHSGGF